MARLHACDLVEKLLLTSFLVVMGVGYLMAMAYLYTSHRGHDGRPGLSIEDIAENYYGNRSGTRLEAAIRGPMSGFLSMQDRSVIVAWLKSGSPEEVYEARVEPILRADCYMCHDPAAGTKAPDLSSFPAVKTFADVDTGESLHTLMRLSHIHLFGIGLILLSVGIIFVRTEFPARLKAVAVVTPFAAMLVDIAAWFLTKWDPWYAYTVVAAGALLGLFLAGQILLSLHQLWLFRPAERGAS